jgi:hypothetical protein
MIVRVRGVKKTRSAAGRVYYYHRATKTRIKAKPNTPEFAAEVAELNKRGKASSTRSGLPGTFGALVAAYRSSPEFRRLADRTRSDYQSVLDWLSGIDHMPIVQLDGRLFWPSGTAPSCSGNDDLRTTSFRCSEPF